MAGLRVNIEGLRFRASDGKLGAADQLRIVNQRLSNPAALRLRAGDSPVVLAEIMSRRQPVALKISEVDNASAAAEVGAAAVSQASKIERPEMIDDSRLSFRAAKDVVPGSLSNGRAIAQEINKQETGRKLRIPTEQELLKLNKLLGDQFEGTNYWIWTETEHEDYPGQFVLRHQSSVSRCYFPPEVSYFYSSLDFAVRFVEDK